MEDVSTSKRHERYLRRFQRNRRKWDPASDISDIRQLRRMEVGYFGLVIFFVTGARLWIGHVVSPSLSWQSFLGVSFGLYITYLLYDAYWVTRSISFMIDKGIKDISELQQEAETLHPTAGNAHD